MGLLRRRKKEPQAPFQIEIYRFTDQTDKADAPPVWRWAVRRRNYYSSDEWYWPSASGQSPTRSAAEADALLAVEKLKEKDRIEATDRATRWTRAVF